MVLAYMMILLEYEACFIPSDLIIEQMPLCLTAPLIGIILVNLMYYTMSAEYSRTLGPERLLSELAPHLTFRAEDPRIIIFIAIISPQPR